MTRTIWLLVVGIVFFGSLLTAATAFFHHDTTTTSSVSAPPSTTTTIPCTSVANLVAARRLKSAVAALAATGACPSVDIHTIEGSIGAATRLVAEAHAALESKDRTRARDLALQALALNSESDGAQALLDEVDAPDTSDTTRGPFAIAEDLHKLGLKDGRDAAIIKAIEGGASADDAPSFSRPWWEWVGDNWVRLLVVGFMLYALFAEYVRSKTRRMSYTGSRAWYPLLPVTRLQFADGVGKDVGSFNAETRHGIRLISAESHTPLLTMEPGPAGSVSLPVLADISEKLTPFDALIKWHRRPDVLTVSGVITDADSSTGRRADIELTDVHDGLSAAWAISPSNDPALQVTLAGRYASGWLAVEMPVIRPHLGAHRIHHQLGTGSPEAFGANFAGVAAWAAGQKDTAQDLFAEALRHDSSFKAAQRNYGVALVGTGEPEMIVAGLLLLLS